MLPRTKVKQTKFASCHLLCHMTDMIIMKVPVRFVCGEFLMQCGVCFQNEYNRVVTALRVVQIALHAVELPLLVFPLTCSTRILFSGSYHADDDEVY